LSKKKIYEIEKLVDCDNGNFAESKRALFRPPEQLME
jgi:hypothetical protein